MLNLHLIPVLQKHTARHLLLVLRIHSWAQINEYQHLTKPGNMLFMLHLEMKPEASYC